jgi:hypothetical protein
MVTPLIVNDFKEAIKVVGVTGALKAIPSIVGVGTQTYADKAKKGSSGSPKLSSAVGDYPKSNLVQSAPVVSSPVRESPISQQMEARK